MDRLWSQMKNEVPHMQRKPSDYLRSNFWYTTQPIEEPEKSAHLRDILNWIGTDRLMFATDYPHWDYDDPNYAFNVPLSKEERAAIFGGTARKLYRL
jgi:predicted TIM-barrel fold metal-dependent hydrolase